MLNFCIHSSIDLTFIHIVGGILGRHAEVESNRVGPHWQQVDRCDWARGLHVPGGGGC